MAAVQKRLNESILPGYGYAGILVAFVARHTPLATVLVSVLLGGICAAVTAPSTSPPSPTDPLSPMALLKNQMWRWAWPATSYILTLVIVILTGSPQPTLTGAPGLLGKQND